MTYYIDDKPYEIEVIRKDNKNLYLRVKDDLKIYIYVPEHMKDKEIVKFISKNKKTITKFIMNIENKLKRLDNKFLYLGKSYEIVYINEKKIIFGADKIFINRNYNTYNFYKKEATKVFNERFDILFDTFNENVKKPELKIRKMRSKWGICNTKDKEITLNLELIKLDVKYLDYVIYHELSHLVHANHSSDFWNIVSKYVPNYKQIRKEMKNIL